MNTFDKVELLVDAQNAIDTATVMDEIITEGIFTKAEPDINAYKHRYDILLQVSNVAFDYIYKAKEAVEKLLAALEEDLEKERKEDKNE